jgi:hypothetical protein
VRPGPPWSDSFIVEKSDLRVGRDVEGGGGATNGVRGGTFVEVRVLRRWRQRALVIE